MTEIQWLLNLMLNYELSPDVKKLCLERIGEVESKLNAAPATPAPVRVVQNAAPVASAMPSPIASPATASMIANLGEVSTGTNLRGPNKLRGRL